jgi:hypothetical protein
VCPWSVGGVLIISGGVIMGVLLENLPTRSPDVTTRLCLLSSRDMSGLGLISLDGNSSFIHSFIFLINDRTPTTF